MRAMADEECTLQGVRVMEANKLGVGLSLGISIPIVLAGLATIATMGLPHGEDGASFVNLLLLTAMFGGFGAYWFGRVARKPSKESGELRATKNGVYLRGERLIAKKEIASAVLWPGRGAGAFVRISRQGVGVPIDLQVPSADEGRALIRALGFSASQTASELSISAPSVDNMKSRIRGSWLGGACFFGGIIGAVAAGSNHLPLVATLSVFLGLMTHATMLLRLFRPAKVRVGADGVFVSWLWRKQFIPIQDIVRAETVEAEPWATMVPYLVRIHLTNGESVDLVGKLGRTSAWGKYNQFARMGADVVVERINEAVAERGQGSSSALAFDDGILARGERAVGEWVAALRGLKDKMQTFRDAAGQTDVFERLWQILEDVQAAPARRAAAAVALSPHLDDEGRERLRVAAQATATPKLRVALEAAADDDDAGLVRALDDVASVEEARAEKKRALESA